MKMGTTSPSSDQFNIRWKNYTPVLHSVFRELLEEERLVDVTLSCEGGDIKCHRIILTACSVYFEKLISQYPLDNHLVIFMKDLKYWELQALVHFMYNGEVSVKQNRLGPLVRAAESLRIRGLSSSESDGDFLNDKEKSDGHGANDHINGDDDASPTKRNIPKQSVQRRSIPQQGRSLLRQPANNNSSAVARMSATAKGQTPPQRAIVGGIKRPSLTNGPPKLIKMQKIEDSSNGKSAPSVQTNRIKQEDGETSMEIKNEDNEETGEVEEQEEGYFNEDFQNEVLDMQDSQLEYGNGELGFEDGGENGHGASVDKKVYKYDKELKDSALAALNTGLSLKQCSEAFGVPRKTLSKWRCREASSSMEQQQQIEDSPGSGAGETEQEEIVENNQRSIIPTISEPPMTGPVKDANDRANRLKKATDLALSGITVRQAAAHYGIPRTTLCAYMKRQGLNGRRLLNQQAQVGRKVAVNRNRSSADSGQNHPDGFLFGLSDLVDDLQSDVYENGDGGEDVEQDYNGMEDEYASPEGEDNQE